MTRVVLLVSLIACASEPVDVEPVGDYTAWKRIDTWGEAPGHGDTYRITYVNDIATTYALSGYPAGSTIIKEVYNRVGDGPGTLRVVELMRSTGSLEDDDGGWVFTAASTPTATETAQEFCWRRCHAAAPFQGAWFDYSK
jgi:Cytochrome P460